MSELFHNQVITPETLVEICDLDILIDVWVIDALGPETLLFEFLNRSERHIQLIQIVELYIATAHLLRQFVLYVMLLLSAFLQ